VTLDKLIKLIDCPGVVFSSDMTESEAALRNCISLDQLNDFILPVQSILQKYEP
jgi:nuclear GTP-binding protein